MELRRVREVSGGTAVATQGGRFVTLSASWRVADFALGLPSRRHVVLTGGTYNDCFAAELAERSFALNIGFRLRRICGVLHAQFFHHRALLVQSTLAAYVTLKPRAWITRMLHGGVSWFQSIRRLIWFFTKPETVGVHGIPLTPDGKVVLVMLSYAPGWRLPGGGIKPVEDGQSAMVRELREEIGLTSYATIELVTDFAHRPDHRHGKGSLFVVHGVRYQARWSLEVKQVGEFSLDGLPTATARITRELLALAAPTLPKDRQR